MYSHVANRLWFCMFFPVYSSTILRPDTESLNETDEVEVYLSAVANPSLFYVQKCSMNAK